MNTKKVLLGGLAGTVVLFLLGWLIYALLLKDFMAANTNSCIARAEEEMMKGMWVMVLSHFAWALLLALVIGWSNAMNMIQGAKIAAITGLLVGISVDLMLYSFTTFFLGFTAVVVDIAVWTAIAAAAGAVIGWVMGMGKKNTSV